MKVPTKLLHPEFISLKKKKKKVIPESFFNFSKTLSEVIIVTKAGLELLTLLSLPPKCRIIVCTTFSFLWSIFLSQGLAPRLAWKLLLSAGVQDVFIGSLRQGLPL